MPRMFMKRSAWDKEALFGFGKCQEFLVRSLDCRTDLTPLRGLHQAESQLVASARVDWWSGRYSVSKLSIELIFLCRMLKQVSTLPPSWIP